MGRTGITLVVIVGLGAAVVPALAAQGPRITASSNRYDPTTATIAVGETVTFANSGGVHNFAFDDGQAYPGSPQPPDDPAWNGLSRTFTQPGRFAFHCDAHPVEMQGVVTVTSPGATTPVPTPTATPTPTPAPGAPGGTAPGGTAAPVEIRTLRLAGATFCTKRARRCRQPGVRVRIDLSRAARVTGTLTRRTAPRGRFGRLDFGSVDAGARTLRFSTNAAGRRLAPGRYTLVVRVEDAAPRTLRFRVR
jgi:plastocyanin